MVSSDQFVKLLLKAAGSAKMSANKKTTSHLSPHVQNIKGKEIKVTSFSIFKPLIVLF